MVMLIILLTLATIAIAIGTEVASRYTNV